MANFSNHSNYAKPESALKRAEELVNVGQKLEALQVLREVVTARRFRSWQKSHETILFKYVELCVDLKKGWIAKDGLIQYRNSCQIVNITSLEDVIKHFMHLATERTELARTKARALEEALDVDDLEADTRPEDLMLGSFIVEKGKDRSDRELVTPWFKFLWETYKTVLEVLKNNSKLETLYAMTAHRAFQFCKQYKRTKEFHRLCDTIRYHLTNLNKFRDQRDRPDLSAPESLQLYLDTRFEQLKIATELELWQEAFRSVEDIYGLMCMVKKTPKPALMVVYYSKLTEIFRVSSSHLHHAYAWFKLFSLQKSYNKNLSQKDLQLIASSVVLAALSVSPYDHIHGASHLELENEKERNLKMSNLIGFNLDPKVEGREVLSRSSLLSELVSKGVMNCASPEVKDLYNLLEHEFFPLDIASKAQLLLTKISKTEGKLSSAPSLPEVQLSQYIPSLEKLATLRLLLQVSHAYKTMKIERLSRMIPFFDFSVVEKISADAVKYNFISLKVDHMAGAILFGSLGLESAGLRDHMAMFSESLNSVRLMIYPTEKRPKLENMLMGLQETVDKEHKRVLARKSIIEKRKEEQERHLLEMEREEESKRAKLQKITEEAEKRRLASEYEQRKSQRIRREIEQRELEEAKALLQEAEKRSKKKGKKPIIEGEKITKQTVMDMALTEQLRERQELEKKLQKLAKTMDHLERAKREEAAPLIEAAFEVRLVEEKKLHELEQQQEIALSRQRHEGDLREKNRLSRMLENKTIFQESIMSRRQAEYDQMRMEREERMKQIIHNRKQERETRRKLLFYARKEEENRKKLQEEEEARRREEADRRRREEAEHRAKLDEIAKKQRQRELELEEKEKSRREALLRGSTEVPSRTSGLPPGGRVPLESGVPAGIAPVATAAAPGATTTPGDKYVPPKQRRAGEKPVGSGPVAPAEPDRWARQDDRRTAYNSDRWRSDDRRTGFGGGSGSRSSTYSSRYPRG